MPKKQSFSEIFLSHGGKVSDKWSSYIPLYEDLFQTFRGKNVSLLEIGIQNGGSLEIYSKYFSRFETLIGCDINEKCQFLDYGSDISLVLGDCNDDLTRKKITDISSSFDIIIDDGSHKSDDIIISFLKYFSILKRGGIYLIEDLHASYWQRWGGGLFYKNSSISFLKLLVDIVNAEHWGLAEKIKDLLILEFPDYQTLIDDDILSDIKSVSFSNSICIIRKCDVGERNTLGRHSVRGSEALVDESIKTIDGLPLFQIDERKNPWSSFSSRKYENKYISDMTIKNSKENTLSISVVMPVYNGARYIREAIQSVIDQTIKPNEFIIVDDGSSDDGPSIIEEMGRKYQITFLRKKENEGQSAARNFAIKKSNSDLIALIDQDDRWFENHLEELIKPFKEHHGRPLGWSYSDFDDIDEDGHIVARTFINRSSLQNPKRDLILFLQQGAVIQPSATLISRVAFEKVGGFDENLSGYEDEDLFLRMFRANYDNVYIPYSLSQWRIYDSSSGGSDDRMEKSQRYYIRKLIKEFPDDKWRGRYYIRDVIAPRFIMTWLLMYMRAGRYKNYKKMREYTRDMQDLIPLLPFTRRMKFRLAIPFLKIPRLGELLIKGGQKYFRF